MLCIVKKRGSVPEVYSLLVYSLREVWFAVWFYMLFRACSWKYSIETQLLENCSGQIVLIPTKNKPVPEAVSQLF